MYGINRNVFISCFTPNRTAQCLKTKYAVSEQVII